ncbi:MAG: neutral/alkaline non-lysosomal ceramidase N-terminal domain-containing protein [Niabella sp.]
MTRRILVSLLLLIFVVNLSAQINAGVGKKVITPELPFLLSGYAARTKPAAGKIHDIWTKALYIETSAQNRAVIITTDVLGLTPEIHSEVVNKLKDKYGFQRSQVILNSSHTHSGPIIWPSLSMIGDYDMATLKSFRQYKDFLVQSMLDAVSIAIDNKFSAKLSSGHGMADFAMNRRLLVNGEIINSPNPDGHTDHDVPVLIVKDRKSRVKAILFGYACHNTTLQGNNYLINGDYAGFAQIELEKAYPTATALFFTGCAGDQNPQPRGTVELAMQHGKTLASAVEAVIGGKTKPVFGTLKTQLQEASLQFIPFDPHKYETELMGNNSYMQRRARLVLQAYNRGWDVTKYNYPVQAMRIGNSLTFISLAGEVVVDYSLKLKTLYPKENLFVAGYCNHVMGYIPTKKVLEEGGYEANDNLIYYGMPGPFANTVEDKILSTVKNVLSKTGVK